MSAFDPKRTFRQSHFAKPLNPLELVLGAPKRNCLDKARDAAQKPCESTTVAKTRMASKRCVVYSAIQDYLSQIHHILS
jgi:hypothetical protein